MTAPDVSLEAGRPTPEQLRLSDLLGKACDGMRTDDILGALLSQLCDVIGTTAPNYDAAEKVMRVCMEKTLERLAQKWGDYMHHRLTDTTPPSSGEVH